MTTPASTGCTLAQLEKVHAAADELADAMAAWRDGTDTPQIQLYDEWTTNGYLRVELWSSELGCVLYEYTIDAGEAPGETGVLTPIANPERVERLRALASDYEFAPLAPITQAFDAARDVLRAAQTVKSRYRYVPVDHAFVPGIELILDHASNVDASALPGMTEALAALLSNEGPAAADVIAQATAADVRPGPGSAPQAFSEIMRSTNVMGCDGSVIKVSIDASLDEGPVLLIEDETSRAFSAIYAPALTPGEARRLLELLPEKEAVDGWCGSALARLAQYAG